jgi:RNA polymerase sigma-70 factor (ECF subfamily)
VAIDYLRKQKPIQKLQDFFTRQKDSKLSTESIVEIKEESLEIYSVLSQLKTSYRQVIMLRKINRFSIQETAQILGWSESKVKSTLHRAIKKLEKKLVEGGVINELSR